MDRFDLRVEVPPVAFTDLDLPCSGDSSAMVAAARRRRAGTAGRAVSAMHPGIRTNADAEGAAAGRDRPPDGECRDLHDARRRPVRPFGAGLSPGTAGGAHHRRSRRGRRGPPAAHRRSAELPAVCSEREPERMPRSVSGCRAPRAASRGRSARHAAIRLPFDRHRDAYARSRVGHAQPVIKQNFGFADLKEHRRRAPKRAIERRGPRIAPVALADIEPHDLLEPRDRQKRIPCRVAARNSRRNRSDRSGREGEGRPRCMPLAQHRASSASVRPPPAQSPPMTIPADDSPALRAAERPPRYPRSAAGNGCSGARR